MCDRQERILRLQYATKPGERGTLPPDWEAGLSHARRQTDSMTGALGRWAFLTHIYRVRSEKLTVAASEDVVDVIGRMIRRTPVTVVLTHREVVVTGRSYNCMIEIARHSLRLQEIETEMQRLGDLQAQALELTTEAKGSRRRQLYKRVAWLNRIHRRLLMETRLQRQALYAHALTPSGAPAKRLDDAPKWWVEMTPEDDGLLLSGMFKVGHERLGELHEYLEAKKDDDDKDKPETLGWHTLLTSLERSSKVSPADYYDRDLFQLTAWAQASHPASADLDDA